MKSKTYAVIPDDDAIKVSIASADADAVYTTTDLDGVIGVSLMNPPRTLTVKTAANVGSYVIGSKVIAAGRDGSGRVVTETYTVTNADGGETLAGDTGFSRVDSLTVQAQADSGGAFAFGVRDITCDAVREIRVGGAGNLKLGFGTTATDVVTNLAVGERLNVQPSRVYGDASTTATKITLFY